MCLHGVSSLEVPQIKQWGSWGSVCLLGAVCVCTGQCVSARGSVCLHGAVCVGMGLCVSARGSVCLHGAVCVGTGSLCGFHTAEWLQVATHEYVAHTMCHGRHGHHRVTAIHGALGPCPFA